MDRREFILGALATPLAPILGNWLGPAPMGFIHEAITSLGYKNNFEFVTFSNPLEIYPQPYVMSNSITRHSYDKKLYEERNFTVEAGTSSHFYDATEIVYSIHDYVLRTGISYTDADEWLAYARAWGEEHAKYLSAINYNSQAYRVFGKGLAEDHLRGGYVTVDHIIGQRDNGHFRDISMFKGIYLGTGANVSREVAYRMTMEISAERVGLPRRLGTWEGVEDYLMAWYLHFIEEHFHYWMNITVANPGQYRYAPFMAGLSARALIYYYETELAAGRDPQDMWSLRAGNHYNNIIEMLEYYYYWMFNDAVFVADDVPGIVQGSSMWAEYISPIEAWNSFGEPDITPTRFPVTYYEDRRSSSHWSGLMNINCCPAAFVGYHKHIGNTNVTPWSAKQFFDLADLGPQANFSDPRNYWPYGGKSVNQAYYGLFEYLKYRNLASGRNE